MRHPTRLLLLPLVLIAAACSAAPGASTPASTTPTTAPSLAAPSPVPSTLPSTRPTAGLSARPSGLTVAYSGILSMDAIEGGCVYLQAADGTKLEVIYPDGWQVTQSPLELVAPDGSVHSKGGDKVSIRGAESTEMASICQIGPIIQATEVLDR